MLVKQKETAQAGLLVDEGKPLLSHWRYGAGRSAAFAAQPGALAAWEDFGAMWSNILKWTASQAGRSGITTSVSVEDSTARIDVADTLNAPADYRANVVAPGGNAFTVRLGQKAPNLYEGAFAADAPGVYPISIVRVHKGNSILQDRAAAVVSYSPEWTATSPNTDFLENVTNATGGKVLDSLSELPASAGDESRAYRSASWLLALIALALFLVELILP